jgi:hypothetical protein
MWLALRTIASHKTSRLLCYTLVETQQAHGAEQTNGWTLYILRAYGDVIWTSDSRHIYHTRTDAYIHIHIYIGHQHG